MGLVVAGIYYGLTLTVLKGYLGNAVALLLSVAIGGLTYFAAALKLGVMSKKRTARNSRRQYDCEICGKIAFAEELDRKFVIEL